MKKPIICGALAAAFLAGTALSAQAAQYFNRIATFHVIDNLPADGDRSKSTVAEIITATADGNTPSAEGSPNCAASSTSSGRNRFPPASTRCREVSVTNG